jgi:protein-histidine pros-kinase
LDHRPRRRGLEDSPSWRAFTGQTFEQWKGWGWLDAFHPEDRERVGALWRKAVSERTPVSTEYRIRHAGGEWRWTAVRAVPPLEADGSVRGWVGMNTDITERKRAEQALRESEARFRTLADAAPVLVWMSGLDKLCTYFNRPWLEFTGRALEQELGNGWAEGVHPDDLPGCLKTYVESFDARRPFTMQYRLRRHDGEYRWISDNGVPRYDAEGNFSGYIGGCIDVTDLRRKEEALRESEARKSAILESALDCIITADQHGRIIEFNPAAQRTFGFTQEEVAGKELAETIIPPAFRERHRRGLAHYLATGQGPVIGQRVELTALRADGSEFPVELAINAIPLAGQTMFTAYLRDITERRRAEALVRQAKEELELKVAQRTAELRTAKERAESADRLKSEFLAGMSHELRTPLNAVIGFTGTLLMKLPGPLTADQERQLRTVQSSAKHLLSLINDLLDLARIDAGKAQLHLEAVVCQSVLEEVAAALRPSAEEKGLKFDLSLPSAEAVVRADRRALSQILLNLTNNAIKFTDRGSVRLELAQRREPGRTVTELSVVDTGVGIPQEDQAKLFQAFGQLGATARRRGEGTGLGLHLSQKLAVLLGGQITFQSEVGKGSRFTLVLNEE